MTKFNEIKEKLASLEIEADKFYNKNVAAAGTRLRNGLQEIKGLCKELRDDVTAKKNS